MFSKVMKANLYMLYNVCKKDCRYFECSCTGAPVVAWFRLAEH